MRGIFLFSCIIIWLFTAAAQEPEVCKQALKKYQSGEYSQALVLYNQCIQYETGNGVPYYNRGKTYYELGQYDKALADYEKAIMLSPEFVQSYYAISEHYLIQDDKEQALYWINRAITLNPTRSTAYDLRGWVYFNFGQYQLAFNDFTEAIRLDPGNATAYNNRASARFLIQDIAEASEADLLMARQDYLMALSLQDSLPNAHRNLGYIELLLGNLDAAESRLQEALKRQPNDAMVYLYLARLNMAREDWPAAHIQLNEAIGNYKLLAPAWLYKGIVQMQQRQYRQAVESFTRTAALDTKLAPEAWYHMARTYAKLFEHDLMIDALKQADELGYFRKQQHRDAFVTDEVFSTFSKYKPFRKFMEGFKP